MNNISPPDTSSSMPQVTVGGGFAILLPPDQAATLEEAEFNDIYMSDHDVPRLLSTNVLREAPSHLIPEINALHQRIKLRGDESGVDEFHFGYGHIGFRTTRMRTRHGDVWVTRRISDRLPDLSRLNLRPGIQRRLTDAMKRPGLVLVSGEVASGKSTTVAATLRHTLEQNSGVAFTIEAPVEFPLQGAYGTSSYCYQNEFPEEQFGAGIRRAMRSAPRFVMVGEIRTPEAASAALRSSLVSTSITTIHGNNVINTMMSIVQMAAIVDREEFSRQILGDTLQIVLHQKLVRLPEGGRTLQASLLALDGNLGSLPRALIREGRYEHLMDEVTRLEAIMSREEAMLDAPLVTATATAVAPPLPPVRRSRFL